MIVVAKNAIKPHLVVHENPSNGLSQNRFSPTTPAVAWSNAIIRVCDQDFYKKPKNLFLLSRLRGAGGQQKTARSGRPRRLKFCFA